MELFENIRRARRDEELSVRELARRFGVHRRTVRQALESPWPPPRKVPERDAPVLGPYKAIIDDWLMGDQSMPKKQRHTSRRIWERLVDEHGARLAESTVREYVGEARRRLGIKPVEVMVPQTHPMGAEAEVDFGSITFKVRGLQTEAWVFVMRLSGSGKAFRRAYWNQAQEVFLDGHVRAFHAFGGCPRRIRYDNLKPAVERVLRGRDRKESDRFVALRSHYGFDSFFCQPGPGGAHEKGGVEGEIGRFRRRHLVPMPDVDSLEELNDIIEASAVEDDHRHIGGRFLTVAEHFAVECDHLLALPAEAFDASVLLSCRVDPKSRVCVRQSFYSVPVRFAGRRLDVRLGASTVEVLNGSSVVARHERAQAKGSEMLVLDHYLEVLKVKPGALPGATALARARASGAFSPTHDEFWSAARRRLGDGDGTRAMVDVLLAHRQLPAAAVVAGMRAALTVSSVDPQLVTIEARRAAGRAEAAVVPIGSLARYDRPAPSLDRYDSLLGASS